MERPILFSSEMVRAILEDRKTETRRVMRLQPLEDELVEVLYDATCGFYIARLIDCYGHEVHIKSPYGKPGDILYVRETFMIGWTGEIYYKADNNVNFTPGWKPSIHMPKKFSRIKLKIKEIRVERIQDISNGDILAEGIPKEYYNSPDKPIWRSAVYRECFKKLWESLNKKRGFGWDKDPFVWVIKFKVIK